MYRNLKAEMVRENITNNDLANLLKVRPATISDKINSKYEFKLTEAFAIKNKYFPNLSIEYLFEN